MSQRSSIVMWRLADDGMTPVVEPDSAAWAAWYERQGTRTLCRSSFGELGDVSTVFLGIDHRYYGDGPPLLWETMIFGGPLDTEGGGTMIARDSSWVRAAARHRMAVRWLLRFASENFPGANDDEAFPAADALARLGGGPGTR